MKVVISQLLIDEIKALGIFSLRDLFGRLCENHELIQVAGLTSKLHHFPLEHVGYWHGGLKCDHPLSENTAKKVTMSFQDGNVCANYQGAPADMLVYDTANYHSRHRSIAISQKLAGKRAAIIGLGSIGGKIAKELAKHGVDLHLFDLDTIEIENPYRLNLGLPLEFLVGLDKCSATEEDIRLALPDANIHVHNMDIAAKSREFDDLIADICPDVMVLSVDTRDGTRQGSATARHHGIPLFQAVLSAGAETGQIRYVRNEPSGACLLCLDAQDAVADMQESRRQYAEEQSLAQKAVPALSVDTSIIAFVTCKLVMAHLAGEDIQRYFTVTGSEGKCQGDVMWISTTPETWIMEDFLQKVVARVEKRPKCPGCWAPGLEEIRRKKQQRKERKQP